MLKVVVGLEQSIAGEELDQDAANAPYVARETPSQAQDYLGCAVVAGRHHARMVFVIKRGRAKIDQTDIGIEQDSTGAALAGNLCGGRRDGTIVAVRMVAVVYQEDVLWLEIRVDQVEVVQD